MMEKNPDPRSGIRDKHLSSYFHIFGSKIFKFFVKFSLLPIRIRDLVWKIWIRDGKIQIRDKHPVPVSEHLLFGILKMMECQVECSF
jgi:hypothetical protein